MYSGVTPLSIALLTSVPATISVRTIASSPFRAAMYSGVPPVSITLLTFAPSSISTCTTVL